MEKKHVSLWVNKEIFNDFRKKCIDQGLKYSEAFEEIAGKWLDSNGKKNTKIQR